MAAELLTVEGAELEVKSPAGASGTISILPASIKAARVKCGGNAAYKTIAFSVDNYTSPAISSGTGAGVITGNTTKTKSSGAALVREDATAIITITDTVNPFGTEAAEIGIKTPGQTKVKAK